MKIAVVGDTHGKIERIKKILCRVHIDHLFFTGDYYDDGEKIARSLGVGYNGVAGNCDPGSTANRELCLNFGGKFFYIVHGNRYGVKKNLNPLFRRGKEVGADVVLFGHTHVPFCKKVEGMWMINPGSPSYPRGGKRPSYAILDIANGEINPRVIRLKRSKINH